MPTTKEVTILIADDHALFRTGIRDVVERGGWTVCGEAHNGREAVAQAIVARPDIVIIDVSMPELNGVDATRQITSVLPHTKVILLTMYHSEELARRAIEAGARGYVLKSDAGETLSQAIRSMLVGSTFFTSSISELVVRAFVCKGRKLRGAQSTGAKLTPRESEILQMLAEGKTTKQVAKALGTSTSTVETQRKNMMHKLHLRGLSDLVRYAIRNHFMEA
jgi:DNA-binding NarL/FixJ family response regulator